MELLEVGRARNDSVCLLQISRDVTLAMWDICCARI